MIELMVHLFGKPILEERDIINTYGEARKKTGLAYLTYLNMPRFLTVPKMAKKLGVDVQTIYNWKKGLTPYPWKAIKWLKEKKLVPLQWFDQRLTAIARLCGFLMGDGNLEIGWSCSVRFTSAEEKILAAFKKDMISVFGELTFKEKRSGNYTDVYVHNAYAARFFSALAVPSGAKVLKAFQTPLWIQSAPIEIKKYFLSGLLSSELSKIKRSKGYECFKGIEFAMSKRLELLNEHIKFLGSLMNMLKEIGVESTNLEIRWGQEYVREDDVKTVPARFFIRSTKHNVATLVREIPLMSVINEGGTRL
jgi:intein/homing endonuclease